MVMGLRRDGSLRHARPFSVAEQGAGIIYCAPVRWCSYEQRPHYLMQALLAAGAVDRVLWLEPYAQRWPRWSDRVRVGGRVHAQGTRAHPRIEVLAVPALPIEPLRVGGWLNRYLCWSPLWQRVVDFVGGRSCLLAAGRPSALAIMLASRLPGLPLWYDAMDDFPCFYRGAAARRLAVQEAALAARADLLTVSSTHLAHKFQALSRSPSMVANATCAQRFPPPTLRAPASRPVLGYVGAVAEWFDWAWVIALAKAVPEARIPIHGPVFCPPPSLPSNVELRPAGDHDAMIQAIAGFSCGLIPFKVNALTMGVDPIKYYDYRALGVPVLSSPFGEMAARHGIGSVGLWSGEGNPWPLLDQLMSCADAPGAVAAFRCENDWHRRVADSGLDQRVSALARHTSRGSAPALS